MASDVSEAIFYSTICDMQYVLEGTFLEFGLHGFKQDAMKEAHSFNMSKLGTDGRPVLCEDGKVLKGPDFRRSDLARILQKT